MATVMEIMDEVLKLPRSDRGYLAEKLIESLDEEGELSDPEKELLDRRSCELHEGSVESLSLEQLKEKVR